MEPKRRGLLPHVVGHRICKVTVRQRKLRWPLPHKFEQILRNPRVHNVGRRAKYLLFETDLGTLLLHLGMSGSLRIVDSGAVATPHDHVDLVLDNGKVLRFNDPRRFGSMHWVTTNPLDHPLLKSLGPEPLTNEFSAEFLFAMTRKKRVAIKIFIMNSHNVVGVGNIYASEALFLARIRPGKQTGRLTRVQCTRLCAAIKKILRAAIRKGGTTLRNYSREDGSPGYFRVKLAVYDRTGEPCNNCGTIIKSRVHGQRASYYCMSCQQ